YDLYLNEQARRDAQAALNQFGPQDLQAMSSYLETQFGVPMRSGEMTLDQAKQRLRAQAALMNLQPSQLNALMFLLEQMAPAQGPQPGALVGGSGIGAGGFGPFSSSVNLYSIDRNQA